MCVFSNIEFKYIYIHDRSLAMWAFDLSFDFKSNYRSVSLQHCIHSHVVLGANHEVIAVIKAIFSYNYATYCI